MICGPKYRDGYAVWVVRKRFFCFRKRVTWLVSLVFVQAETCGASRTSPDRTCCPRSRPVIRTCPSPQDAMGILLRAVSIHDTSESHGRLGSASIASGRVQTTSTTNTTHFLHLCKGAFGRRPSSQAIAVAGGIEGSRPGGPLWTGIENG